MTGPQQGARRLIDCSAEKDVYLPGETVTLSLSIPEETYLSAGDYCVTVVPAGLADTLLEGIPQDPMAPGGTRTLPGGAGITGFSLDLLPEIRGISVSGSVVPAGDSSLASQAPRRLHFSMLGENPEYFGVLTDESGRFIVTLPERTGTCELFVAAEPSAAGYSIRIDQDFATDPLPFSPVPFDLSPSRREAATRMVMNMQLAMAFSPDPADPDSVGGTAKAVPFYGAPSETIRTEDYVNLPTMTEVFENLVPDVYVKYSKGEPYLKIESRNNMIDHLPPLILMEGIPVFDQQAVLAVDPAKILKIELINEVYVRGSMFYGGVLAFTSREGDMASVDLPGGSYFFDYQAFHPAVQPDPDPARQIDPDPSSERIPDSRNTLMWTGSLRLGPGDAREISFKAASCPGAYIILVRGLSPRNEIICGTGGFRVEAHR